MNLRKYLHYIQNCYTFIPVSMYYYSTNLIMSAKQFIAAAAIMLAAALSAFAQKGSLTVTGTVYDQNGSTIPLASVLIKGTTQGVAADLDGNYSITVPSAETILEYSSIGYLAVDEKVNGRKTIDVTLATDTQSIDETIVVAYGTANLQSFTGAAGKVSGDKIALVPNASPLNTLNGSTPGIRVLSAAGQPGSDATITVRGIGSLNGNTDPLIVVDGMIFSGNLATIPSSDIESITVLKDAASTALYGSRAANGVIMITTRQGKGDVPQITARISHGFVTREQKDYKKMNVTQYMETNWRQLYNNQIVQGKDESTAAQYASENVVTDLGYTSENMPWKGDGVTLYNLIGLDGKMNSNAKFLYEDDIDWIGNTEQVGQVQDYSVSASGRSKYSSYYGSVGYLNNEGYVRGSGFERLSARANVSFEKKWLKFGTNLSASIQDQYGNPTTNVGNSSNIFHVVLRMPPMYPIHRHYADGSYILDENGSKIYDYGEGYTYGDYTTYTRANFKPSNPAAYLTYRVSHYTRNIINAKPYVEVRFLKDFKFSANGGIYVNNYESHGVSQYVAERSTNTTSASVTDTRVTTYTFNQLLTWNHAFGQNHFDLLLGHESNAYTYNYIYAEKQDQVISGDNYELNNYLTASATPEGYRNNYNTEGYFTRLNYDYAGRYFLSASFRRDGSSKFSSSARWGNFWSLGGSWLISNEKFMQNVSWVDNLKLRASYGTVGSDDLGSYYPYMALYLMNYNDQEAGYTRSMASTGNVNLQWEVSNNWDAALEWQLFGRRLTGSFEYFHRQTNNLLMEVTLPSSTGLSSYNANDGGILNSGIEFSLAYDVVRTPKVNWNLGINGSLLHNEITYLPVAAYTKNGGQNKVEEGHSVYEWWLYQWEGVNPETGLNYYALGDSYFKEDGSYIDNIESDADLVTIDGKYYTTSIAKSKEDYSGSSVPKVYGGITSDLRIGRFGLNINLYYQLGAKSYDLSWANMMHFGITEYPQYNKSTEMLDAWTKPGDKTDVAMNVTQAQKLGTSTYKANVAATRSTRWLASTNYLEINSLNASYDFGRKACDWCHVDALKLYISADHLAMFNTRRGMYSSYSLSNYTSNGAFYKPARTISVGAVISL